MQNRSRLLVLNIGERIRFYDVATIVRTLLLAVFFFFFLITGYYQLGV